ncbi:MAG: hypothetical protein ACOZNI_34925 [Myxococcota bacterium]
MLLAWVALAASATHYGLDAAQGALYVRVAKDTGTVASALAHDHVVVASGWKGRVAWGEGVCSVDLEVPVRSLVVDDPTWRARLGIDQSVSERQRRQIHASMLGEGQLHADAFPQGGQLRATGRFTIRATEFGFEPYSAFLGAVKNLDEMEVVVDVVGVPERPPSP